MQGEDQDGQVDGDAAVPFATTMRASPWLRGAPPWHLWGNSQVLTCPVETTGQIRQGVTNQLVRIAYKRPETWHWMFQARLISGPNNSPTWGTDLIVHWEMTVGIGRSAQRMHFELSPGQNYAISPFEQYRFRWTDPQPFPRGAGIWTTKANAPSRYFGFASPPDFATSTIEQIVAEDIQLQVQCVALTDPANVAAVGQNVVLEVSAQFAPAVHIRPDWLQLDVPVDSQFPGAEVGGR